MTNKSNNKIQYYKKIVSNFLIFFIINFRFMHKKLLESIKKQSQKLKSPPIRQSSSGNKNIKLTNHGIKNQKPFSSKQQKQIKLTISQSPKNNKKPQKSNKKQQKSNPFNTKQTLKINSKNKKQIVSYKTQQTPPKQDKQQDKSLVQIDFQDGDQNLDDNINLLSISNYKFDDNNTFLRQTHITNGLTKKTYSTEKNNQKLIKKKSNQKPSPKKLLRKNSKRGEFELEQIKKNKMLNQNYVYEENKMFSREKGNNQLQISYKTLKKSSKDLEKSHKKLQVSTKRQIQKSNQGLTKSKQGTFKNKNEDKQKKSQSGSSKKRNNKISTQKKQISTLKSNIKIPDTMKPPKSKSNSKQTKPKKSLSKPKSKLSTIINPIIKYQQSSSDTTDAPTFEQLQKLRQQNQKYKLFLATSAFKVQQLKRQIQQSKQVRQTQKSIYNFQLQNMKKQLDANKKFLGHLYSYDDNINGGNFLPQQIIIQTDNESSSVLDSVNALSKVSKQKGSSQNITENNSYHNRKSLVESGKQIRNSNPLSDQGKQQDTTKQNENNRRKSDQKDANSMAEMKFLSGINKIPSLVMQISLQQSDKGNEITSYANYNNNQPSQHSKDQPIQKKNNLLKKSSQYSDMYLLLNSKGK